MIDPSGHMRFLFGFSYYPHPSLDIKVWIEAHLARLRQVGIQIDGFPLTLNPPGHQLYWPQLDNLWHKKDATLLTMYEKLLETLENYDIFVNWNGINVHPELVRQLPTFNVYACFDDPEASNMLSKPVAWAYDLVLVGNIAELDAYRSWGIREVRHWPLGFFATDYDPTLTAEKILSGNRDIDISLLCEREMHYRAERIERFVSAFPNGTYYGKGWPNGFLPEQQKVPLYQRTKIGPNFHNSTGPINFRTFILPANGVMQICDNRSHLAELFELDKEAVGFDTVDEAIELTRYYLAHDEERRRIAAAGWQRAVRDYNEVAIFRLLQTYVGQAMNDRENRREENGRACIQPRIETPEHSKDSEEALPHRLVWNERRVAAFWNFIAQSEAHQADYFAKQVGTGIVNFLRHLAPLEGRILDYGCGPGYLTESLLASGIPCEGCDYSNATVAKINQKFSSFPLWGGARHVTGTTLPYPDNTFDLILCLETIEHVLDSQLHSMLKELHRILKPETGLLFITTPNDENLDSFTVFCPECGSVFHRYQHLRSFTGKALEQLMQKHNFKTNLCNITLFNSFQRPDYLNTNEGEMHRNHSFIERVRRLLHRCGIHRQQCFHGLNENNRFTQLLGHGCHLFWIGSK